MFSLKNTALTCMAVLVCSGAAFAQSAFEDPGARTPSGTPGDLRPVNEKSGGAVALGSSTQVVVLFRNDDAKPIKVNGINLYPSSNITASIGENQCSEEAIMPGEVCATTIQVKGLQQGNYRIEMLVRHDGRTKLLTTTIEGAVEKTGDEKQDIVGDIEVNPSEIDFGTLTQSRIQLRPVVLRNITSQPVKISDVTINAGENSGFTVNADCDELATGAACIATIKWMPQQPGPSSAMAVISHDGPTRISTVSLKGEYAPSESEAAQLFPQAVPGKGLLVSSQESIDFRSISQPSSITVSLVNTGDSPLKIKDVRTSGARNGLEIEKRGCVKGSTLESGQACPLTLTLSPVRDGDILDDVQIFHDGARGILVLPVRGSTEGGAGGGSFSGGLGGDSLLDVAPLSVDDLLEDGGTPNASVLARQKEDRLRSALSGYILTSFAKDRAIITKDGVGKIIYDGTKTMIDGLPMDVSIRKNLVEFLYDGKKVFLLFDGSFASLPPGAVTSVSVSTGSFERVVEEVPAGAEDDPLPTPSGGQEVLMGESDRRGSTALTIQPASTSPQPAETNEDDEDAE